MPAPEHPRRSQQDLYTTSSVDFRALYYTLRERSWIVALCFLVAAASTAAYLLRAPKIYASKSVLQIEQEEQKILNIQRIQQEDLQSLEFLKTVEQTLQNSALLERVLDTNNLVQDARFAPRKGDAPPSRAQLVTKLTKMVEVKLRKGTRLIDIKVEHTDPGIAQLVGASLVKEFLRLNFEHNSMASEVAGEFLETEARQLKKKLEESENALQAYKEETKSASLEERQNIVVEKLKELNQKVTEAKSQRITQETAYSQVQKLGDNPEALMVLGVVANNPSVLEIKSAIAKQQSEVASLRQRYKDMHPKLMQATSELAEWKKALSKAVLNVPQTIRSAYESARAGEQALEQALREQEVAALELNKQSIRYNVLARDVESDRALYQSVFNRIKETSVTKDIHSNKIRIIQPADRAEKPVKPETIKVILIGLFAGLGSGILFVLFLNALDRSLKTVDQTEEHLGLPVLSAIPKFSGTVGEKRKLISADDADSSEAEAFRTLRTSLSMLGRKEDRRIFLFTSALPSEGKTFCSLNYAISLAQQGLRTLIIDCDLRRPMVEKSLLNNNKRGFGVTDYLTGQKDFNSITHTTEVENFFYLPAGSNAPNPAELLAQTGIDRLIDEALLHFDRVIIDSAPIHAVSDTLLILNRVQTLCLVVRARKTPRNSVKRAVQILQEAGAPMAGVILNLLPRMGGGYGYYYYYDSYYDYGYHGKYGQKPSKDKDSLAA